MTEMKERRFKKIEVKKPATLTPEAGATADAPPC